MKRPVSLLLAVVLAAAGCAPAVRTPSTAPARPDVTRDPSVMAEYIRQIPIGSRVRLTRTDGSVIRGTLMKRDADPIVVQRRARIPEPPVAIPVATIASLELDTAGGGNVARAVTIAAAAAAAATLGVILVLAALVSD